MPQKTYIFNQLCALLPRDYFEYLVRKYKGNDHSKTYSCWNHFLVLLWAQLTHRESLRDIETSLRTHREKLYRLGMGKDISRSTISYANSTKEVALFRDFSGKMMELASQKAATKEGELKTIADVLKLTGIFAIDSSTVYLNLERFKWSVPQNRKGGIKLHTLYDILREVPTLCLLTGHEERDQRFMNDYPYRKGALYVFDKAYVKVKCLKKINDLPAYFIVRRKKRMSYAVLTDFQREGPLIYGDKEIQFTNRDAKKGYPKPLRLVQYYSPERNEVMDFLTNNFQMTASMVAYSYKNRWAIELFFRWIKQHLYITRFYGTSANAVFIQIYVAVAAYCLVAIASAEYRFHGTLYELLSILSVSLLEKQSLSEILERYENPMEDKQQSSEWPSLFDELVF